MPSRPVRTVTGAAVLLSLIVPGLLGATTTAAAARPVSSSSGSTAPVYAHDFPDPAALTSSSAYYAYSTGSATTGTNLQVMSSSSLTSWAGPPTEALPWLPKWATVGSTWAPAVIQIGTSYLMYYTVRDTDLARQCISVAVSSSAGGPFKDNSSGPLVCDPHGSIDPSPILVGTSLYLVWKSDDNSVGATPHLWSEPLASNGMSLAPNTSPSELLSPSVTWQGNLIEGPSMVAVPGSADFDLFYGANAWDSSNAGIGYAVCSTPSGPCTNKSTKAAWMATNASVQKNGPSGPSVFQDANGVHIAYHAWGNVIGYPSGARQLWIDSLSFSGTTPYVG